MPHQEIRCNVRSCKYNSDCELCTLEGITVGCESSNEPQSKQGTVCASFCCR
jgi:hypothetical protein